MSNISPSSNRNYSFSLLHSSSSTDDPLNAVEVARAVVEFIEVAIHTILYVRQVYPTDLFVRRKKYDIPVFQSRHPALNEYVSGAVKAVGEELVLGNVDKVIVVIKDGEEIAMERFIFSIRNMIQVEAFLKDSSIQDAMSSTSLRQHFRSFLVKLSMIESQLVQVYPGDNASFAIVLELQDDKRPSVSNGKDPPQWVPTRHTMSGAPDDAELHMIQALDTGIIKLSLTVQESAEKLARQKEADGKEKPIEGG